MIRNRKIYLSLGLVCLFLGILIAYQLRATSVSPAVNGLYRIPELTARLSEVSRERDLLVAEVVKIRKQKLESASMDQGITDLALAAGQLPGQGKGLRIIVKDSLLATSDNPNDYIVHDYDLQFLVNDLRAGDAEGIAINGERVTAATAIKCAGPTIIVNLTRIAPPYIIDCVGDAQKMEAILRLPVTGWYDYITVSGVQVDITRMDQLTIPASKMPVDFQFLQPTK